MPARAAASGDVLPKRIHGEVEGLRNGQHDVRDGRLQCADGAVAVRAVSDRGRSSCVTETQDTHLSSAMRWLMTASTRSGRALTLTPPRTMSTACVVEMTAENRGSRRGSACDSSSSASSSVAALFTSVLTASGIPGPYSAAHSSISKAVPVRVKDAECGCASIATIAAASIPMPCTCKRCDLDMIRSLRR